MPTTRRSLILRAAAAGGAGAALAAMHALGVSPASASEAMPRDRSIGAGKRVVVLGGGMAGLVSAYELERAGFDVLVLEARARVGGRNWTLRGGDRVAHKSGPEQRVLFDDGMYFNAGPARLPSHHHTILDYCRELNVPLEVEVNASRSAYVVSASGRRMRMSQVVNDTRGYVSELLAKAASRGRLDDLVPEGERRDLVNFLRGYGDLKADLSYTGSSRAGWKSAPGAARATGVHADPIERTALFSPRMMLPHTFEEIDDMQPTMFQPAGGMDQIPKAFGRALGRRVRMGAEVLAVRNTEAGAEVVWRDTRFAREQVEACDFVISSLPAPLLARTQNNFSQAFQQALLSVRMDAATKLAWQSERFWERDDHIFGGLGYIEHEVRFLWYPSNNLNTREGVLVGCYNTGGLARASGAQTIEQRAAASRAAVELAHPGRGGMLRNPVSVVWADMPFNEGPWANLALGPAYDLLNEPDGRVHLAGDWLSQIVGWQEGAALSGQRAVRAIIERTRTT